MVYVLAYQGGLTDLFNHQSPGSIAPSPAFLLDWLSVVGVVFVLVIPNHWTTFLRFDQHYHHGTARRLPVRVVESCLSPRHLRCYP